jgi:hypothetical protein
MLRHEHPSTGIGSHFGCIRIALPDTLARASAPGLRVALLESLEDVDDLPAWQRARAKLFANSLE